nr:hypothetical protein [Tanacetum cinerariifolium]
CTRNRLSNCLDLNSYWDPWKFETSLGVNDQRPIVPTQGHEIPPGFSPKEEYDENSLQEGGDNKDMEYLKDRKEESKKSKFTHKSNDGGNDSTSTGHFKVSELPRTGGSILGLFDEVVKETDTQEKDKDKAKNDKTEHEMETIKKDKVIRIRKSKVKARAKRAKNVKELN